jgi:hypothetical protein
MLKNNILTEIDACLLYQKLADNEKDAIIADVSGQVIFGLIAAAITFGIGEIIGVSITG